MARARLLKPGFFKNEELAQCEFAARILFEGLWCLADREGRLEDRPLRIKVEILPYDNVDANALLDQLAARNLIVRYEVNTQRYIQIATFKKNQHCHVDEPVSVIPAPPQDGVSTGNDSSTTNVAPQEHHGSTTVAPHDIGATSSRTPSPSPSLETLPQRNGLNTHSATDAAEREFADFFNDFWQQYPKNSSGIRPGKKAAEKAARRVVVRDRPLVLRALANYAYSDAISRGFVKNPQGFLNPDYWRDWLDAEPGGNGNGNGTKDYTAARNKYTGQSRAQIRFAQGIIDAENHIRQSSSGLPTGPDR